MLVTALYKVLWIIITSVTTSKGSGDIWTASDLILESCLSPTVLRWFPTNCLKVVSLCTQRKMPDCQLTAERISKRVGIKMRINIKVIKYALIS